MAETFNLGALSGYRTGGTVHIITNNQVGFTTDMKDARSTRHASDRLGHEPSAASTIPSPTAKLEISSSKQARAWLFASDGDGAAAQDSKPQASRSRPSGSVALGRS